MLAYFRRTQSTPLSDPDGDAVAVVVARTSRSPEEYRQVQERVARERPVLARVRTGILLGAAAATYVGPCMLFGLAAATLNSAFPALELLVLGGLVAGRLRARRGATGRGPGGGAADVEERVYDRLTAAVVTTRGTAGVLMAAVGAAVSVFLLVPWAAAGEPAAGLVVARWRFAARLATGTVATAPDVGTVAALTDALVATGSMVALPVAAGHAAWYWTRALRRFSALVEDGPGGAAPVARVPGLALPATGLVVAWSAYVARFDLALPVEAAFALAWPPLVAAAAWSTLAAWRGTPQSLAGTGRRLVAAHVTFVVGVVAGFGFLVGMTGIRRALLVPVMATWIYYLDPVRAASEETGGGALRVGYAALPLVVALVLRPVVPPGLPVLAVFAALPVATAVGVGLRRASEA